MQVSRYAMKLRGPTAKLQDASALRAESHRGLLLITLQPSLRLAEMPCLEKPPSNGNDHGVSSDDPSYLEPNQQANPTLEAAVDERAAQRGPRLRRSVT
jgi:hypothetical protein